jgi:hypothetical protein
VAAAWAEQGNSTKEKMLKQLKQREQIKSSHWRIKFLHGKLEQGSTTMVTILDNQGCPIDLTQKSDIEQAILRENA